MAKSSCVFCSIAAGEMESHRVVEDDDILAFLDHRPLFPGHCLLIPRAHHETLADVPEPLVGPLFSRVKLIARAVERALEAEGTFVAMNNRVSQSVPHAHVHVVPRRRKDGLRGFFWPRQGYEDEEHAGRIAAAIRNAVAALT